jgi:tRNA (guanine-N7-)-methyltransferase
MDAKNKKAAPYQDVPTVAEEGTIDLTRVMGLERESVEIEIGFGKGHFILDRAKNNPNTSFWGLEVRRKWVHLVTSRALKRELSNVRVQYGDARQVLPRIAPDCSVARFFINFPDPWWKARHLKRIVVTDRFIGEVGRLLQDDGELFVQTDVDFRARDYRDILLEQSFLEPVVEENGIINHNPFAARSLREIKCEEIGLPIYRMLFRRKKRV